MILFRDHTYASFVASLLREIGLAKRDEDAHALTTALGSASREGLWLQFGVYDGRTLSTIAKRAPDKIVYGFDSFWGLPEQWRSASSRRMRKYVKYGAFNRQGVPPRMPDKNIAFVIGWFNETLPPFINEIGESEVSLLHIDSDLYSSAQYVLRRLKGHMKNRSLIVFDELVNYPEYQGGELRALWDVYSGTEHGVEVVARACRKVVAHPRADLWPQAVAVRLVL